MRVGIDARLVHYTRAGIGEYTLRLAEALASANPDDHFTLLQDWRDRQPLLSAPNLVAARYLVPSHHRLEQTLLPVVVRDLQVQVFHSPDFIPPLRAGGPAVITIHDLAFVLYPHFLTGESARYYGQIDRAVHRASQIIAVSHSTKRDAVSLLGVAEDKITVIHEAADPRFRPVERAAALRYVQTLYDLPPEFILFVSTLEPRKNVVGLLQAYRRLRDDYGLTPALALAGNPGWLCDDIYEMADKLDLRSHCHFLGRVTGPDLLQLYNAAICLVHPAFYEGFGLPPLEAMACGTPVVCSNVASLPEVVGDAALLVDPNNNEEITVALSRVLGDPQLWAELREKGLRRAQTFSWQLAAEQTMAVYRKAIG